MIKVRVAGLHGLLFAALALPACGDGGDDSKEKEPAPVQTPAASGDAGRSASSTASDPIGDLINTVLGDGGLAGLGSLFGDGGLAGLGGLFGDGGLAGLGGLFGDGGFPNLGDGGFDPSTFCAQVPRLCPDGGSPRVDAGTKADDAGELSDAASSADAGSADAGSADAGSADAGDADAGT